jgi:hypothetical protein
LPPLLPDTPLGFDTDTNPRWSAIRPLGRLQGPKVLQLSSVRWFGCTRRCRLTVPARCTRRCSIPARPPALRRARRWPADPASRKRPSWHGVYVRRRGRRCCHVSPPEGAGPRPLAFHWTPESALCSTSVRVALRSSRRNHARFFRSVVSVAEASLTQTKRGSFLIDLQKTRKFSTAYKRGPKPGPDPKAWLLAPAPGECRSMGCRCPKAPGVQ